MSVAQLDSLSFLLLADTVQRSVYVTVMCLLAGFASWLLGRRLPYLQLALWSLVLVRAILPTGLAVPFSLRETLALRIPDLFGYVEFRLRIWDLGFAAASPPIWQALPWLTWHIAIVSLWVLVSAILLVHFLVRRRFFHRLLRRAETLRDPYLQASMQRWRSRYGIRRQVRLCVGAWPVSPFTLGLWRPAIYLPRRLLRQSSRQDLDAVIGHELAHVRRFDDFWVLFQGVLRALFFFLPPLLIAVDRLAQQRELVCDQMAVRHGSLSARQYARSLVRIFASTLPGQQQAASVHLGGALFCSARIRAVGDAAREGARGIIVTVIVIALVATFILPMEPHAVGRAAQVEKFEQRAAARVPEHNPGFLWPLAQAEVGDGFGVVDPRTRVSYRYHSGLDLLAPVGAEIRAMADGEVERVVQGARDRLSARTGGYMTIRHGQYLAYYTYLKNPLLTTGDQVAAGQPIGRLGAVGYSPERKPPHLHLEITRDGISIDPRAVLRPR